MRNRADSVVGTPEYMAPEQARGDAVVDQRADVFALGAMLADITRGVAPLVAVAQKAQAEDPAQRYQSVPALAAEVNRYLAGRAVEAHREPFIDRIARVVRRNRLRDPARADLSRGAGPADLPVPRLTDGAKAWPSEGREAEWAGWVGRLEPS